MDLPDISEGKRLSRPSTIPRSYAVLLILALAAAVFAGSGSSSTGGAEALQQGLDVSVRNAGTLETIVEYRYPLVGSEEPITWEVPLSPPQESFDTCAYDKVIGGTGAWRNGHFGFLRPLDVEAELHVVQCYHPFLAPSVPRLMYEVFYPRFTPMEYLTSGWNVVELRGGSILDYEVLPRIFPQFAGDPEVKNSVRSSLWSKRAKFLVVCGQPSVLGRPDSRSYDPFVSLIDLADAPDGVYRFDIFLSDGNYLPADFDRKNVPFSIVWRSPTAIALHDSPDDKPSIEIPFSDVLDDERLKRLAADNR